jgi:hypothetical protein
MRWSYKTVHYELKKEGLLGSAFLDESEMELSLNEYGKAGWELVSVIENMDGLVAVFKQPLSLENDVNFPVDQEEKHNNVQEIQPWEDDSDMVVEAEPAEQPTQYKFADKGVFSRESAEKIDSGVSSEGNSDTSQVDIGDIRIE